MNTDDTAEPEYIRCVHNSQRGLLISSPPQCVCEYCNRTWVYGTPAPVCPILKTVQARTKQETRAAVIAEFRAGMPTKRKKFRQQHPSAFTSDVTVKAYDAAVIAQNQIIKAVNELLTKMEGMG